MIGDGEFQSYFSNKIFEPTHSDCLTIQKLSKHSTNKLIREEFEIPTLSIL